MLNVLAQYCCNISALLSNNSIKSFQYFNEKVENLWKVKDYYNEIFHIFVVNFHKVLKMTSIAIMSKLNNVT